MWSRRPETIFSSSYCKQYTPLLFSEWHRMRCNSGGPSRQFCSTARVSRTMMGYKLRKYSPSSWSSALERCKNFFLKHPKKKITKVNDNATKGLKSDAGNSKGRCPSYCLPLQVHVLYLPGYNSQVIFSTVYINCLYSV